MFLHLSVILFTGVSAFPQCHGQADPPPPPQSASQTAGQEAHPSPPPSPAYGEQAGGTHPTGMHNLYLESANDEIRLFTISIVWYPQACIVTLRNN